MLEEMRKHFEATHERQFQLSRDVSFEGNANPEAILTHRPGTPASAEGFWCGLCPGRVFLSAPEPDLSEERIAYLAQNDPPLAKVLAEPADGTPAERVKALEEERSAPALLARHRRRNLLRTRERQPAAQARREGAQAYLLDKYEQIGNRDEALWSLSDLRREDPARYRKVMGTDRLYAYETVKKYWYEIPPQVRAAAKQRFRDRQGNR